MQQQQSDGVSLRTSANILYLLLAGHSTCFVVFTRHSFGVESLGINGFAALGMMIAYLCHTNSPGMLLYIGTWFLALAVQRAITFARRCGSWFEHSRFEGHLWLGFLVPFVRHVQLAKIWEAALVAIAGIFLCGVDAALGPFFLVGFFSLLAKASFEAAIDRKRLQRMRDAQIEMEHGVDRWNRIRS
jgi:hypothetical protein